MSRFADPKATARLSLGACQCPGTPHTEDWLDIRTQVGVEDALAIVGGGNVEALRRLLVAWNLQEDDIGTPAPIDEDHIGRLFSDLFDKLDRWLKANVSFKAPLPNGSAAPSQASTGESGSPTPNPTKGNSSTTSPYPATDGVTTTSGSQRPSS